MPARKPIRRAQLISPFGIGAMVDFPRDESLMVAGLDAWHWAKESCPPELLIIEERLQARLGVRAFRLPVDHREPGEGVRNANLDIPTVRFPRWQYCHRCGAMECLSLFSSVRRCPGRPYKGMSCADKEPKKRPFLIPVRIIAVCERGHIEDFPFMEWVHRNKPGQPDCTLRFLAGRSSSLLTGIKIRCSCDEEKTLAGIFDLGVLQRVIGYSCRAGKPWLGKTDTQGPPCGCDLRVLQRGASNVYFPRAVSSIYLPLWAERTEKDIVESLERPEIWDALTSGVVEGKRIDPVRCDVLARMWRLDRNALLAAAQRKLDGINVAPALTEEEYRRQEYLALLAPRGGPNTDLFVEIIQASELGSPLNRYFTKIGLVKKLRETRALAGFSRLLPPDPEGAAGCIQPLKLDQKIDWLPASVVRGEGIFLELNAATIGEWLRNKQASQRANLLSQNLNQRRLSRGQRPRPITMKFLLLHALAHCLINQLSFDCGYGSASLRERLYCNLEPGTESMCGILIYTASGDSDGTMGGLVRQGEPPRLLRTLLDALQKGRWCSSDPICIETTGQGTDNSNLAACHGCLLISETSCEEGNRLLDRAMLVGKMQQPEIGYFSSLL
jgi:MrfA Zn-binding domain